jgi:hypothetical protein
MGCGTGTTKTRSDAVICKPLESLNSDAHVHLMPRTVSDPRSQQVIRSSTHISTAKVPHP